MGDAESDDRWKCTGFRELPLIQHIEVESLRDEIHSTDGDFPFPPQGKSGYSSDSPRGGLLVSDVKLNDAVSPQSRRCANCGITIPQGTAQVWSGVSFCSLQCVALFGELEFSERARRLAASTWN